MPTATTTCEFIKCTHCGRRHAVPENRDMHTVIVCECGTITCLTANYRSIMPMRAAMAIKVRRRGEHRYADASAALAANVRTHHAQITNSNTR